jgi:hypothetical protein
MQPSKHRIAALLTAPRNLVAAAARTIGLFMCRVEREFD